MNRFYHKISLFLLLIFVSISLTGRTAASVSTDLPRTVPEKTNHTSTSTYKDVHGFFMQLKQLYPKYIDLSVIGKSFEEQDILMITLGNPAPSSHSENKKPVIMINANIHAGEVEGKEAVQMLSRDILKDEKKRAQILDSFTILILPVLNV
ncbi:MAG: hypothetical protein GY757_24515, partial [bacterium]|nr:hypothetical protein [bacterium]